MSFRVLPRTMYYLGASSHPVLVTVTSVDDECITYRVGGDNKNITIQRWIGEGLIERGTRTEYQKLCAWMRSGEFDSWVPFEAARLERLLERGGK